MKRWLLLLAVCVIGIGMVWGETAVSGSLGTPVASHYLPYVEKSPATPTPTTTPTPLPTPTPTATPQPGLEWLDYVNQFRALANLPHLTENPTWSAGGVLHGRYMVKNDVITHAEDPTNPWYTAEGDAAGRNGNVAVSSSVNTSDRFAIDLWMTGPFHAIGIIDPQLSQTGFGSYREAIGAWRMGATLDVLRGLGALPPGTTFPIFFPKEGGQMWLTRYNGNEAPDPLTSCPGYSAPSGPPVMLQLGSGNVTPNVTASSFLRDGQPLEHCIFDETNYVNNNGSLQSLGRSVLNGRDAIVIMPRSPLVSGSTYTASVTTNGNTYTWSFTVTAVRDPDLAEILWQIR